MLLYPPFATFILLSYAGDRGAIDTIETEVKRLTAAFPGDYYTNPTSRDGKLLRHALFRLSDSKTKRACIETLKALPPYVRTEIDPDRIV